MGNGTFWGVDSVAFIDSATSHGTLAHYVINYWFASPPPHDSIVYWCRYFAIFSPDQPYHSDNEALQLINEIRAYSHNYRGWIITICDPPTNTVKLGTASDGNYWGNVVCQNISYWLSNGPHTLMPGHGEVYTFLDIE